MITNRIRIAGALLAIPAILWLAGDAFGFGRSFDKPTLQAGQHPVGTASKGTLTYTVNGTGAEIMFVGKCGNVQVNTGQINVTLITDIAAFQAATEKAVADDVEGWFVDIATAVNPFRSCYTKDVVGIYITAVNKSILKTNTMWIGEATIQGVVDK